jgi:hypothetical protein
MGITPLHAELIIKEHKRHALPETIHLLGRQTVLLTIEQAVAMMRKAGFEPIQTDIEIDRQTHGAQAADRAYISDRTFFGLLGAHVVHAIDYTDYEGADIILDLTKPIPPKHAGTVDFLFGGSVLDNIFDPAIYLRNVTQLLRPGGRLFEQDIISQHHHPYCLVTPAWVFDYFAVNAYEACTIYVCEHGADGVAHIYGLSPSLDDLISDFGPPRGGLPVGIMVIAEKGLATKGDLAPIQDQYRSSDDQMHYRDQLAVMKRRETFFSFDPPSSLDQARLGRRTSKSLRYLGVIRPPGMQAGAEADNGLRILQATYGGNCLGMDLPRSGVNAVYRGNVTEVLGCLFNGGARREWCVDVNLLGDPAPQCGKDLEVLYAYATEPTPRVLRAYLPAEAHGNVLSLSRESPNL